MIIKSKSFILRTYRKGDEKSLREHINNKEVSRFMSSRVPFPYKTKDAKWWIKHCSKLERTKNSNEINFAIDINGKVVGGLGLMNKEKNHKAEIGYWLGKKYWNKGIMTKAVKLMTDFGFKKLKLKRVYATVFPKNKASVRILEKSNYKLEGLMSKHHKKNGKYFDALLYARIK
ncbi:MAG TPA: GNAT family protein [Candidatus Nanoarchaeia archaeon]|nr:GNAT family protein [Candidatus Nanoarchaeia archaeon]